MRLAPASPQLGTLLASACAVRSSALASLILLTVAILASACGGDGEPTELTGPATGAIRVISSTTGSPTDPDGYRVSVDGGEGVPIGTNGSVVIDPIPPGAHTILLSELSPECSVTGNPRTVMVVASTTAETSFEISCRTPTGRVQVTSVTLGSAPDPDGYLVQVGGAPEQPVGANETISLDVATGEQTVLLAGLDPACAVSGDNPLTVAVTAGSSSQARFIVSCPGSAAGQLAFTTNRDSNDEIYLVNADGTGLTRLTSDPAVDLQPTWAPDGSRLAFSSNRSGPYNIYVMDADGKNVVNLSQSQSTDFLPAWSPDGTRIAFVRDMGSIAAGAWEIFVMDADGGNQVNLTNNIDIAAYPDWSPDGNKIVFESDRDFDVDPTELAFEIFSMQADGTNVVNLSNNDAEDEGPSWSPDGERIAFFSDRAGNLEIFVMDPAGANLVNLTNHPAKDFGPAWSPNSDRIAFSSNRYNQYGADDLLVMAPDGTGVIRLTPSDGSARFAAWRP